MIISISVYLASMGVFFWFKKSMSQEDNAQWVKCDRLEEC